MIFTLGLIVPFQSSPSRFSHLGKALVHNLFDVVNRAIQSPLDIYLDLPPEGKTVQALVSPDIGKNRFGSRKPLRVNLASLFGIDLGGHSLGQIGKFHPNRHPEISPFAASGSKTPRL